MWRTAICRRMFPSKIWHVYQQLRFLGKPFLSALGSSAHPALAPSLTHALFTFWRVVSKTCIAYIRITECTSVSRSSFGKTNSPNSRVLDIIFCVNIAGQRRCNPRCPIACPAMSHYEADHLHSTFDPCLRWLGNQTCARQRALATI